MLGEPSIIVSPEDLRLLEEGGWYLNNNGYAARDRQKDNVRTRQLLHRVIMDAKPGQIVDHINGLRNDNRRTNLRLCNKSQNAFNSIIDKQLGKSRERGIGWDSQYNKWIVRFYANGKRIFGGRFTDIAVAKETRDNYYYRYHGEFANLTRKRG